MKASDLADLIAVVESIRAEGHPELSEELLRAVVEAEKRNPDDDEEVLRAITYALNSIEGA